MATHKKAARKKVLAQARRRQPPENEARLKAAWGKKMGKGRLSKRDAQGKLVPVTDISELDPEE